MQHLKIFIELTRLNKPIGFMLLFWPCAWSVTLAQPANYDLYLLIYFLILFFLGSILMRSAGCIVNDIVDKDFDIRVSRTKKRPIASGKVSTKLAITYVTLLCSLAFIILIQFNLFTIILGMSSMLLAFTYPFMKRYTYWPQLFLGLTFNWGIIMAWAAVNNNISIEPIILYIAAIFWTLGYDTIYGAQDMADDEIIGLKSTSIKFKKNMKVFVSISYLITSVLLAYLFFENLGINIFSTFLCLSILSLFFQVFKFNKNIPETCLFSFKINNLSGLLLFFSILAI
tara:strand:- start:188 stop:1042 length:855 start_codon:yes stop_codon:yes gene_type:complete